VRGEIGILQAEMAALRAKMKQEMAELRLEIRTQRLDLMHASSDLRNSVSSCTLSFAGLFNHVPCVSLIAAAISMAPVKVSILSNGIYLRRSRSHGIRGSLNVRKANERRESSVKKLDTWSAAVSIFLYSITSLDPRSALTLAAQVLQESG